MKIIQLHNTKNTLLEKRFETYVTLSSGSALKVSFRVKGDKTEMEIIEFESLTERQQECINGQNS